jgi:hypothetical protein
MNFFHFMASLFPLPSLPIPLSLPFVPFSIKTFHALCLYHPFTFSCTFTFSFPFVLVLGQCAVLGMELMCVATSYSEPDLKSRVDSLERMAAKHHVNHREERHVKAVCEFGRG